MAFETLHKDYFRDRWTVIAPDRANRHFDMEARTGRPADSPTPPLACSFCAGHESETPPAVLALPPGGPWQVRVIPNLFPIIPGSHEVVIETPDHGRTLAGLRPEDVALVFSAIDARLKALYRRRDIAWVQAFKNQGRQAGASLSHAHSQLVALPVVPGPIAAKSANSVRGHCAYCAMARSELLGPRFVAANRSFVAFCPAAPNWEREVWIVARRHIRRLPRPGSETLRDLVALLSPLLTLVESVDPAYNMMVFSGAPGMHFHFHLEITPRPVNGFKAGLELATDLAVLRQAPDAAAAAYRQKWSACAGEVAPQITPSSRG